MPLVGRLSVEVPPSGARPEPLQFRSGSRPNLSNSLRLSVSTPADLTRGSDRGWVENGTSSNNRGPISRHCRASADTAMAPVNQDTGAIASFRGQSTTDREDHFEGGLFPRPPPDLFPVVLGPFGGLPPPPPLPLPPLFPPPEPLLPLPLDLLILSPFRCWCQGWCPTRTRIFEAPQVFRPSIAGIPVAVGGTEWTKRKHAGFSAARRYRPATVGRTEMHLGAWLLWRISAPCGGR